jgi:multiple sugar transport system permease protein
MIEKDHKFARLVLLLVLISGAVTMCIPFLWAVTTSLKDPAAVYTQAHSFIPRDAETNSKVEIHWENYLLAWTKIPLARYYFVSIVVAVAVTLGRVFTSSLAAYAFARLEFPGRDKLFLMYLATLMIPGEVILIPTFIIISKVHLMNTFWALILPGMFTAFGTFMLRQFFLTLPKELEEAATVDGCSRLGVWWRIIMPLSTPALVTLTIFTFLGSWNDFMWPLVVTHTKDMFTIPVGLAQLKSDYSQEITLMLSASVQVLLPVFVLFILCQKRVTQGLIMSGMGKF